MKIPAPWIDKVESKQPSTDKENELLAEHWMDEKSPNSRLGCQVRTAPPFCWYGVLIFRAFPSDPPLFSCPDNESFMARHRSSSPRTWTACRSSSPTARPRTAPEQAEEKGGWGRLAQVECARWDVGYA